MATPHFDLSKLTVATKRPPRDLLDYEYEWEPSRVKTYIEDEGVQVFVKKGALEVSTAGSARPVRLAKGDLATFGATGELVFDFKEPTTLCHEAELLFDPA
jgi:hypothetical protein